MDDITKKRQGAALEGLGEHINEAMDTIACGVDQLASKLGPEYPDNWIRERGLDKEGFYWAYLANHNTSMAVSRMERHGVSFKDAIEYFRRTLDTIEKLHEAGVLGQCDGVLPEQPEPK